MFSANHTAEIVACIYIINIVTSSNRILKSVFEFSYVWYVEKNRNWMDSILSLTC